LRSPLCYRINIATLGGIEQFTNLYSLNLIINDIEDISPLTGLTPLNSLDLCGNDQLSCAQLDFLNDKAGANVVLVDECSNDIVDGRLKWRVSFNTDGSEAWHFDIKGTASTPKIATDGTIYVLSTDGNLYARSVVLATQTVRF
jgi:hypothetical protein